MSLTSASAFERLSQKERRFLRGLHKRAERERERACLIEGEHLCQEYATLVERGALSPPLIVVVEDSAQRTGNPLFALAERFAACGALVAATNEANFRLLCDAQTPQGILAAISYPELPLRTNKPLIILDSVADPGNVGAIARAAEWFGVPNILLCGASADRFHPKTLRSSMGAIFRCAIHRSENIRESLREHFYDYQIFGASLQSDASLQDIDFPSDKFALALGNEARGISGEVEALLTQSFRIPRHAGAETESLNVAVAAGVILYHCAFAPKKQNAG
jgi:TrmH family RNA methyltransferase